MWLDFSKLLLFLVKTVKIILKMFTENWISIYRLGILTSFPSRKT